MKPSGVVQRTAAAAHSDSSKQDQAGGSANASAAATAAGGSTNDLEALIQRQEAWVSTPDGSRSWKGQGVCSDIWRHAPPPSWRMPHAHVRRLVH